MYTRQDFLNLENLTQRELKKEIVQAKKEYIDVQEHFRQMEIEQKIEGFFDNALISVQILTQQLGNIEAYITKAEGLINEEIGEVVLNLKAIKKRRKMKAKLSL